MAKRIEIPKWLLDDPKYQRLEELALKERKAEVLSFLEMVNDQVYRGRGSINEGTPFLMPEEARARVNTDGIYLTQQSNLRISNLEYHQLMPAPTYFILFGLHTSTTTACFYAIDHIAGMGIPLDEKGDYYRLLHLTEHNITDNLQNVFHQIFLKAGAAFGNDHAIFK